MLREKVTFSRNTQSQDPVTGDLINTLVTYYWPKGANVRELQPSVDVIVQQQNISMLIEVQIRYNPEVNILNGDKIEWRGFTFNALSPKVDPMRTWITIKAFSEIETTNRESNGS